MANNSKGSHKRVKLMCRIGDDGGRCTLHDHLGADGIAWF